ncbi:hypothetical protein DNTS_009363 [Danionella cerebrum]|uniref:Choline transporter-like protein n=1 Tax=Danionella cerebrum TaxID=2873325 RepID=A0A553PX37_9TELE|nr:hypothetical protein DNTS_009363 [Danionella translucida]
MGRKKKEEEENRSESSEYGAPAQFDPSFSGPIHNRSCTDVICCILFMLVITGYMVVGILDLKENKNLEGKRTMTVLWMSLAINDCFCSSVSYEFPLLCVCCCCSPVAWLYGDPRHVLNPRNSTGMFCGIGQNKDKPSVMYFDIIKCATATNIMAAALQGLQCPTTQVCVKSCPSDFWALSPLAYFPNAKPVDYFKQELCVPSFQLKNTTFTVSEIINKELCSSFTTPTTSVLGRCLPSLGGTAYNPSNIPANFSLPGLNQNQTLAAIANATGAGGAFNDLTNSFNIKDVGLRIFEDFAKSWQWIVAGLVIAMVVSILFLLLLRFTAPVLIWVLIFGVLAVGAFGIWYCYNEYMSLASSTLNFSNVGFTTNVQVYLQVRDTWLAFLIILCVVEGVLLLALIFLRTRILIAIALIQETSRALGHMMSTLFYPVVTFVLVLVCVSYWGITALYLATSGSPVYKVVTMNSTQGDCSAIRANQSCDPETFNSSQFPLCPSARCVFINYNTEGLFQRSLFNLQIYNVFAFLWCVNFVLALGHCSLAGAFASYYWAFSKPSDIPMFPLTQAFIRALRYHVGSLAFGALILTLIQMVRIILEYLDHKFKGLKPHRAFVSEHRAVSENISILSPAAQNPCARFIMCCLKCCFWCLEKFIKFINRNAYIMVRPHALSTKPRRTSSDGVFLWIVDRHIREELLRVGEERILSAHAEHRTTVVFGAYLIAHGFFSVYNMGVDTLFLCFLEDLERNDGSPEKPYFMSKNLMKILNKKNKQPKSK